MFDRGAGGTPIFFFYCLFFRSLGENVKGKEGGEGSGQCGWRPSVVKGKGAVAEGDEQRCTGRCV